MESTPSTIITDGPFRILSRSIPIRFSVALLGANDEMGGDDLIALIVGGERLPASDIFTKGITTHIANSDTKTNLLIPQHTTALIVVSFPVRYFSWRDVHHPACPALQ